MCTFSQADQKVLIKLFQKFAGSRGGALADARKRRNTLSVRKRYFFSLPFLFSREKEKEEEKQKFSAGNVCKCNIAKP